MKLLLVQQHPRSCLTSIAIRAVLLMLCAIPAGGGKAADSGVTLTVGPTASSAKPALESGDPASIQPDELKTLLDGVPDSFRKNRSDLDLARDLGIHAWAIEYTGGP